MAAGVIPLVTIVTLTAAFVGVLIYFALNYFSSASQAEEELQEVEPEEEPQEEPEEEPEKVEEKAPPPPKRQEPVLTVKKATPKQQQCELGKWIKSGTCSETGNQAYIRTATGCPTSTKTVKAEPCCATGSWFGTGKCEGEYETQNRKVTAACSPSTVKTRKVITDLCKREVEAARLRQKEIDEENEKRLKEIEAQKKKELAIQEKKRKEEAEALRQKQEKERKEAKQKAAKLQACRDKSWEGVVLTPDYKLYIDKDKQLSQNNVKHGTIKIDVEVDKKDYTTTKTHIKVASYDWRGNHTGWRTVKTYKGVLFMNEGKLILMRYMTKFKQGPKKYYLVAEFKNPDKHAVVLVSPKGGVNRVLFINKNKNRVYDLINGEWIDNPHSC